MGGGGRGGMGCGVEWCGSVDVMWRLRYIWGGGGRGKNMGRDNVEVGPVRENELPGGGGG